MKMDVLQKLKGGKIKKKSLKDNITNMEYE